MLGRGSVLAECAERVVEEGIRLVDKNISAVANRCTVPR